MKDTFKKVARFVHECAIESPAKFEARIDSAGEYPDIVVCVWRGARGRWELEMVAPCEDGEGYQYQIVWYSGADLGYATFEEAVDDAVLRAASGSAAPELEDEDVPTAAQMKETRATLAPVGKN